MTNVASVERKLKLLSGYAPEGFKSPDIVRLDYPDADLYLYITARVELRSRAIACAKEPWTVDWIRQNVGPGDVVYDIGANVGPYSLISAARIGPSGRVVSFEPGYASFAHLCDNLALNNFGDRIIPVPLPLSSRTSLGGFSYHRLYPGYARHAVDGDRAEGADVREMVFRQHVLMVRLDDAIKLFGLPRPNHMKIDVDGWEAEILEGGPDAFGDPGLRTVLIEVEVVNTDAVTRVLSSKGFKLDRRFQREVDGKPVGWWTGLFRRPQ